MTYEPRPGTTAYRAIAHLETLTHGAEIMGAALAEAIGAPPVSLATCLEPALNARRVFRRQCANYATAPHWYSLVDHSISPGRASQQVLKAEPATADATDREAPADASPRVGAMGAGQPADAGPDRGRAMPGREAAAAPTPASTATAERGHAEERPAAAPQSATLVGRNATISLTGEVAVIAECGTVILFDKQRAQQLLQFFARRVA